MKEFSVAPKDEQGSSLQHLGQQASSVQSVDRAMTVGALWMILARLGDRSLGLISTIILVRLLAPSDFGLVAMGMSLIAICELFGQVGLDVALIQNPDATRRHYDTAWTFSVILSAVTAVVLISIAVPAANFYNEPRLQPVVLSLALATLISGFENIGTVAFRKELRFTKEFQFVLGKKLAGFFVTVPLAFILRSYWALIAGIIFGRLASVAISYYVQEYRPRWSLEARHELFRFSKWIVAYNACTVLNSRAADFIVGKIGGAHALGIFNVSYEISNLPTSELIAPINRAVFPGYARKSEDNEVLRRGYLNVIGMIAACGIPAGVGIAATSNWVVPLFLGQKWNEAIPLIAVLAFYGILTAMKTNAHYVYLALGKPYVTTYLTVVQTCILIPTLVVLTLRFGAMGAAYGYLVAQTVFTPISFSVLFNVLGITVRQLTHVLWRPVVSAAFMFAAVRLVICSSACDAVDSFAAMKYLVMAAALGAAVYGSSLYAFWMMSGRPMGAESSVLTIVQTRIFRVRRKVTAILGG